MSEKRMTQHRILVVAALLPLLLGCSTAGDSSGQRVVSPPERPVTSLHGNEFLVRGPSR